jgi:predicted AlkP superfamily phosphohydrolase/phosphomutase
VWTTIASGYAPTTHGIPDWTGPDGNPFRSMDVRVQRLWDVTTTNNKTTWVFNWLLTMPVSTIQGVMTSEELVFTGNMDTAGNHAPMQDPTITTKMLVWPPSFCKLAAKQVPSIDWVNTTSLAYQFDRYSAVRHPMIRDESTVRVFESLVGSAPPALAMVYLSGADVLSHRIWPFTDDAAVERMRADPEMWKRSNDSLSRHEFHKRRRPFSDGVTTDEKLKEGRAMVEDYYRYLDSLLGRIMNRVDPKRSTLLVVSDHGFFTADSPVPLFPEHSERAVLMGWGSRVKHNATPPSDAKDLDVAPTVYALLGLPTATDMPGRILTEHFETTAAGSVATYATPSTFPATERPMDFRRFEELKMLGYVDDEGRPIQTPRRSGVRPRSP